MVWPIFNVSMYLELDSFNYKYNFIETVKTFIWIILKMVNYLKRWDQMHVNRSHSDNWWWEVPCNMTRIYNTIIEVSLSHSAEVRNKRKLIPIGIEETSISMLIPQRHPYLVVVVLSPHNYSITSGESATDRLIQSTLTATWYSCLS